MLSGLLDAPTLVNGTCSCRSATEHRNNNAHLVLRPTWNDELGSEKETQKRTQTQSTIGEDARTNTRGTLPRGAAKIVLTTIHRVSKLKNY